MIEFEIDGKQFRFEKLTAMQQFHLSRKLAPLLASLMPVIAKFMDAIGKDQPTLSLTSDVGALGPLLQPFAEGLSSMEDASAEFIFNTCLQSVWYKHANEWTRMWSSKGNVTLFDNLNDPSLLLRLVVRVITENLSPFIQGFLTSAKEPATAA